MPEICKHAVHVAMVREAVVNMPALVVHRVSHTECGHKSDELHPATWAVTLPVHAGLRQVRLCDRHFALFILDREQFEQIELQVDDGD